MIGWSTHKGGFFSFASLIGAEPWLTSLAACIKRAKANSAFPIAKKKFFAYAATWITGNFRVGRSHRSERKTTQRSGSSPIVPSWTKARKLKDCKDCYVCPQVFRTGMAVGVNNAAVINWTKSLSLQCAADGILGTAVAPGRIDTPHQIHNRVREAEIRGTTLEVLQEEGARDIPLKRVGRPEEVANLVVFLATECSSYMTGTCVAVVGGVTRGI